MEAIRLIKKTNKNKITINLPKIFGEEVEVIVLPSKKKYKKGVLGFKRIWGDSDIEPNSLSKKMRDGWGRVF